jgi:hemolysin III
MTKQEIKNKFKKEKNIAREEYTAKIEKAQKNYIAEIEALYSLTGKTTPINPPKRPLSEEIGNAITHGAGAAFAIVAFVLMLLKANTPIEYVAAVVYFVGMFVMFMCSCLYHAFAYGSSVKRLFHRFDYSSIYLLIGSTFTPILLCFFGDIFGIIFFAIQWLIIACGISLVGVFGPKRFSFIHIPMYIILGWSAVMLFPGIFSANLPLGIWILAGGAFYTIGIIPFLMKSAFCHFIWHFFVLAGVVVQWIGIYLYLF